MISTSLASLSRQWVKSDCHEPPRFSGRPIPLRGLFIDNSNEYSPEVRDRAVGSVGFWWRSKALEGLFDEFAGEAPVERPSAYEESEVDGPVELVEQDLFVEVTAQLASSDSARDNGSGLVATGVHVAMCESATQLGVGLAFEHDAGQHVPQAGPVEDAGDRSDLETEVF